MKYVLSEHFLNLFLKVGKEKRIPAKLVMVVNQEFLPEEVRNRV